MPANASIGEPFALSSYNSKFPKPSSSTKEANWTPVYASHTNAHGNADGYATVTAQSDGIHVLDISDLHPVLSHTLGPTITFCSPAISYCEVDGDERFCTTFAAIESTPELSAEERGKTIWMWRESLSSQLSDRSFQKKRAISVPHRIFGLRRCEELPSNVLILSPEGHVTILDKELKVAGSWTPDASHGSLLRAFYFFRQSCTFSLPATTPSGGAILVTVVQSEPEKALHVQILSVDDQFAIVKLGASNLPNETDVADCTFSPSGYLTVLSKSGIWHTYTLETSEDDKPTFTPTVDPFRLKGMSFLKKATRSEDISLYSTTASHVLLSALTDSPTPDLLLQLWDLQYGVLLASQSVPLPSSLADSKNTPVRLRLTEATATQAVLVLSPTSVPREQKAPRSTVLVVPFVCPPTSTIANALGQATASAKWIDQSASTTDNGAVQPPYDASRANVVAAMQVAMEKNLPQAANKAFFEWESRESKAAAKNVTVSESSENVCTPQATLGDAFVKDLLMTVFQPTKPANTPYSSEIVRHLLNRKSVSSSMLEGGLLIALRVKDDWPSILLAMTNVIDLTETEILDCLRTTVTNHRRTAANSDNTMQIDSASELPTVEAFLALCANYTMSAVPLRNAIRRLFPDPEEVLVMLKVLDEWLARWLQEDEKLLPSEEQVAKNEKGVSIVKEGEGNQRAELPSLQKILLFLQSLLDATFLTILPHSPSHSVLRSIQCHIDPRIASNTTLEQLRGPLESYSKAQKKVIKETSEDKKNKPPVGDWRQRRKRIHEQNGLAIGLYQIEELVL